MTSFKRFEDIQAWQKARVLVKEIYVMRGRGGFGKDFDLRSQTRRAAISIMANIAEGQGRRTDKDFANFLNISLGSIAESKSHMYLALDLDYVTQTKFNEIYEKLDEVGRMVFSLSTHLRQSRSTSFQTSDTSQTS
jgi:four helix bundle protein